MQAKLRKHVYSRSALLWGYGDDYGDDDGDDDGDDYGDADDDDDGTFAGCGMATTGEMLPTTTG